MDRGFQHFAFMGGTKAKHYPDISEILLRAKFWLDANSDEPFFLYLHLMNIHGPYRAPESFKKKFVDGPVEPFAFQSELWLDIARRGRVDRRSDVIPALLRDINAQYDGAIAYSDDSVGDFLENLSDRGILNESVLVITSDHGEEMFDHGSFGHRNTLHAELVNVPLLIRPPGGRTGVRRVSEPVSLIDLSPTVLDLAGLLEAQPDGRFGRGQSLLPLFRESKESSPSRLLMAELLRETSSGSLLQLWPHRLITMVGEDKPRLYRIDVDPNETVNRVDEGRDVIERILEMERAINQSREVQTGPEVETPMTEALRRQLEALGYIDEEN